MDRFDRKQKERHGVAGTVLAWIIGVGLALWGVVELLQWLGWIEPF